MATMVTRVVVVVVAIMVVFGHSAWPDGVAVGQVSSQRLVIYSDRVALMANRDLVVVCGGLAGLRRLWCGRCVPFGGRINQAGNNLAAEFINQINQMALRNVALDFAQVNAFALQDADVIATVFIGIQAQELDQGLC